MDEEKTLKEKLTSNCEESADLLMNGDVEHQIEMDSDNEPIGRDGFGGSIPEQNTSERHEIEEKELSDPKPLDSPIDDRLSLSSEPIIQHSNGRKPNDLSETSEPEPKPEPKPDAEPKLELEPESKPETNGVLTNNSFNNVRLNANDASVTKESHSGVTNGEVHNHKQGTNGVFPGSKKFESEKQNKKSTIKVGDIDTTAPFESVKAAVTMFGGIIDWKAHKIQMAERRRYIAQELKKAQEEIPLFKRKSEASEEAKVQVLKELDSTKRLIEELKLNLERSQTEERQAKQDAELAKLRVQEMEQGIADNSSVAAKAQLEVAHARHEAAIEQLKNTKSEHENLQKDYDLLMSEKEVAVKKANEAMSNSKEIEKEVERLTIKLITTKEALESAHAAHMEAEEHRIGVAMARDQDALYWEKELRQSEEELEKMNQQIVSTKDLKSKLETASILLQSLKAELGAYMGENLDQGSEFNGKMHKDIQSAVDLAKSNLEEVKKNIEKATDDVTCLRLTVTSLNSELEREKLTLFALRQREGMASVAAVSLQADLNRTISEIEHIQMKEKEAREKTTELPKQLQKASEEADHARSRAREAHEELQKAKKAADQAKAQATAMTARLHAAQKEIEAARASERLALGTITALQETESARSNKLEPESGVTLSLEEYYELSRKAQEAEDLANSQVSEAMSQIDVAKESELKARNKLDRVNSDLALKKEQLSIAMQKAEKAKEGKLVVEQELRKWRSENEQRRKAKDDGGRRGVGPKGASGTGKEAKGSDNRPDVKVESNNSVSGTSREGKPRKKKKRSLIPRIFMFFRKKGHSNKNNNT